MPKTHISLPDAARALNANGLKTSYIHLWRAVVENRIPAERVKHRWIICAYDLPGIADTLANR